MYKLNFILVLILSAQVFAQTPNADIPLKDRRIFPGFLGIPCGANIATVQRTIEDRNDGSIWTPHNADTAFSFYGRYGDYKYFIVVFHFFRNQFYQAEVILKTGDNDSLIQLYNEVYDEIRSKYGLPDIAGFPELLGGDKKTLNDCQRGENALSWIPWFFKGSPVYNSISLKIIGNGTYYGGYLKIEYECGTLSKEAYKEKNPNKKDY